jgi:hypothetical protein
MLDQSHPTIETICNPGLALAGNLTWLENALADVEARRALPGYVYLLHLTQPIGRPQTAAERAAHGLPPTNGRYQPAARHYLGWCKDLAARIQAHKGGYGSRFMAAARRYGVDFEIARVWIGGRDLERQLKRQKNTPRFCPICNQSINQRSLFELTPAQIDYELVPF